MKLPFSKGPTLKFLDSTRRYNVTYRARLPGADFWKQGTIGITARSEAHCRERVIRFVSSKWRAEVEVMKVELEGGKGDEMPLQTGEPVTTVSESEYEARTENALGQTEEERKAGLRAKGLWIP